MALSAFAGFVIRSGLVISRLHEKCKRPRTGRDLLCSEWQTGLRGHLQCGIAPQALIAGAGAKRRHPEPILRATGQAARAELALAVRADLMPVGFNYRIRAGVPDVQLRAGHVIAR